MNYYIDSVYCAVLGLDSSSSYYEKHFGQSARYLWTKESCVWNNIRVSKRWPNVIFCKPCYVRFSLFYPEMWIMCVCLCVCVNFCCQQCFEHEEWDTSESSGRWNSDDPGHTRDGPGRLSVHGQKCGRGGEDFWGYLAILQVTLWVFFIFLLLCSIHIY